MPINNIFWSGDKQNDIHVIAGQSFLDLTTAHLAFAKVNPDGTITNQFAKTYLNDASNANDVTLTFKPLFKGAVAGDNFSGHGITVNTKTGVVTVVAALPAPRKNNFIMEAVAVSGARTFTEIIRIHVHQSISQVWLTPSTLSVRPFTNSRPENTTHKFSVRAQFDDGIVGDITKIPGLTWSPTANVNIVSGSLILKAGDSTGNVIPITVNLAAALGGGSATANMQIEDAWDITHPTNISVVVGGGWPGIISPEKVANVLFISEGFSSAQEPAFRQYVNSLVQFLKTNPLNKPYNFLATSMNFWAAFMPSPQEGFSIASEVFPVQDGAVLKARFLPTPGKPPTAAATWSLEQLVYVVGLPVPADDISNAARTNPIIKTEWQSLIDPDPSAHVNDALINQWRFLAKRSFIDEVNSVLHVKAGDPVPTRGAALINFNSSRMDRDKLDKFLVTLQDPHGIPVQDLWAKKADGTKPNNYDLICIVANGFGRALNAEGYFFINILEELPIQTIAGKNAFAFHLSPPTNTASADKSRTFAHEVSHSFFLDDEYGEREGPSGSTSAEINLYSNIILEADTMRAGQIHGDEIKWNWHRIKKAAMLSGDIQDAGGGKFRVQLVTGQGFQFAIGNTVHFRFRRYPAPLIKNPKLSPPLEITDPAPTSDTIHIKLKAGAVFNYPNLIAAAQFINEFKEGSIVFIPVEAPASVKTNDYPYAEVVAKNIKDYITTNHKPLTVFPSVIDNDNVQQPIIPGVSLPDCFNKNRPRIVGLYSGGDTFHKGYFHATGNCMMRDDHTDGREFCAVCSYILTDTIDPYKHFEIDREYQKIYPQE